MGKNQYIAIVISIVSIIVIYLAFDTVSPKIRSLEKSRHLQIESTGLSNLLSAAQKKLDKTQSSYIEALQINVTSTRQDTNQHILALRELSKAWLQYEFPAIAANYAEEVANVQKNSNNWNNAGQMYRYCIENEQEEKVKVFCTKRAINAFEKAISLEEDNKEYRINLALVYVEAPPSDNPMQGILMLRELNQQFPDNVEVLNQLGKLAIQTNQLDKALERLEKANSLEPENKTTICLLADVLTQKGLVEKAEPFVLKCNK
ncbi:MAG: hypothetical protein R2774_06810 [Saprospiraceae bacterium]